MALSNEARRRYARHLLLAEVGEPGQARLCAHEVRVSGDERATEIATLYLSRAGVAVRESAPEAATAPSSAEVAALAGRPELREAAAFLAGAFTAVEEIKRALGVGTRGALPSRLSSGEPS